MTSTHNPMSEAHAVCQREEDRVFIQFAAPRQQPYPAEPENHKRSNQPHPRRMAVKYGQRRFR